MGSNRNICKPPLESNNTLATKIEAKQASKMPFHMPLLGFINFLAPINKTKKVWDEVLGNTPQGGDVYKLSWGQDYQGGTGVPKMPYADIKNYFEGLKSLARYDMSFRKLYVILQDMGVDPPKQVVTK